MHTQTSLRILVVDDYRDSADALAALLDTWGYDATATYSGAHALELAASQPYDCVLLDVMMPLMSGGELARELRRRYGGNITLIAMTGADINGASYQLIVSTVDHFLAKPIDSAALRKVISNNGR